MQAQPVAVERDSEEPRACGPDRDETGGERRERVPPAEPRTVAGSHPHPPCPYPSDLSAPEPAPAPVDVAHRELPGGGSRLRGTVVAT